MIATTGYFDTVECDFYNRDDEMCMTINQLARALEYASTAGIGNIISRNEYLNDPEFSVTHKLCATDGKYYDTRLFTEDGIYEVSMLSGMPKARTFRAWVRKLIKAYRRGALAAPMDPRVIALIEEQSHRITALEQRLGATDQRMSNPTPHNALPQYGLASGFINTINTALQEGYFLYRKNARVAFDETKLLGTYDRDYYYIISGRAYDLYACKEENPVPRVGLYACLRNDGLIEPSHRTKTLGHSAQRICIQRKEYNCLVFYNDKVQLGKQ